MPKLARPAHHRRRGGRSAWSPRGDDAAIRAVRARPQPRGAARLMPLYRQVVEDLRRIVGPDNVVSSADDLRIFERDGSIEGAAPDAVVLPANVQQVSDVIKLATRHRLPVVPRGAGTGLSGGAVTIRGGIAL